MLATQPFRPPLPPLPNLDRWATLGEQLAPLIHDLGLSSELAGIDANEASVPVVDVDVNRYVLDILRIAKERRPFAHLSIDTLFIGVCPDWGIAGTADDFDEFERWLDTITARTNIALAWNPYLAGPLTNEEVLALRPDQHSEDFPAYWQRMYDFQRRAQNQLGDRFYYWPKYEPFTRGFVDPRKDRDRELLQVRFNLTPKMYLNTSTDETLLKQIFVFGQQPQYCVTTQTQKCGLREVTCQLDQMGCFPALPEDMSYIRYDWRQ